MFLGFTGPAVAFDREDRVAGTRNAQRRGDSATRRVSTNAGEITLFLWLPCPAPQNSSFDGFASRPHASIDPNGCHSCFLAVRIVIYSLSLSSFHARLGACRNSPRRKTHGVTACFRLTLVLFTVRLTSVSRAVR